MDDDLIYPHPENKFVSVTICRARGLLSRDATNAVAPITSESMDIFVSASASHRVSDIELQQPPQLLEQVPMRVQLMRTPAVASNPVNPTWPSDATGIDKCRLKCPVAAMPLIFDVFGQTMKQELFLGRATLTAEQVADPAIANSTDAELRLELLPREDEDDKVVKNASETFLSGLGLLVVAARIVEAPPPPPKPVPPAKLIEITVPKIDVLSPLHRPNQMCLVPGVAQPQQPGLVDVTADQQRDAMALEARDPAFPLHQAQMVEISLHSCAAVVDAWISELRAAALAFNPGKKPPPPPQKFEVVADVFGATFSSGLLSTNLEDVQQYYRSSSASGSSASSAGGGAGYGTAAAAAGGGSALSLFSVYGSVCARAGSNIPIRLRFVDGTGHGSQDAAGKSGAGGSSSPSESSSASTTTAQSQSMASGVSGGGHSRLHPTLQSLVSGEAPVSLYDGREVFAETSLTGTVPVPEPEQFARDAVNHPPGSGLVGNRALLPINFHSKHGGGGESKLSVELSVKSVSCVPAKNVTESRLYHGKGLMKIEVREVRDLVTPKMIAEAAAAARGPNVGNLRSTFGLFNAATGAGGGGVGMGSATSAATTSQKSGFVLGNNKGRSPSPVPSEKEAENNNVPDSETATETGGATVGEGAASAVAGADNASETSAGTARSRKSKYSHSAATKSRKSLEREHQQQQQGNNSDPLYCEVAIKDNADDKEYKLLGRSPCVFPDSDSFFGFTTTVELDSIHKLPEVVIVGIFQAGDCIARSVVHVLERKSIDGTWVTLKPPIKRGVSLGDGLRGMVWVRWVATPQQQQPQQQQEPTSMLQHPAESARAKAERENAMSIGGSAMAPVTWIQKESLVPDLVRSPAAPNGLCEMILPTVLSAKEKEQEQQQLPPIQHQNQLGFTPPASFISSFGHQHTSNQQQQQNSVPAHEVGYREAGALCIDWNAMPVGLCLRLRQGDRTLFGPALRVQGHRGPLKAPPVIVYIEGTLHGAPPLVFETFRCPEDGAPLVVRDSDRVYERKCWLPVDVNLLQQYPPTFLEKGNNNEFSAIQQQRDESSWLQAQNAATSAGVSLRHHLTALMQQQQASARDGDGEKSSTSAANGGQFFFNQGMLSSMPQHPPCFTVALDEIAAIKIPCRWVPLIKKIPPPPPPSRSNTPALSAEDEAAAAQRQDRNKNKFRTKPPMHLRIVGPTFSSINTVLEEDESLEKVMPMVERHFGIAAADQLFHQGRLKLLPNGRPQVAGTASKEQSKSYVQSAVVTRLAGESAAEQQAKQKPIDVILSNKDARAIYLTVKLSQNGVVVPLAVPYGTNVAALKLLLQHAIVSRRLLDPQTGAPLAESVDKIQRLCHLNRILRDETAVRNIGVRPEMPILALMSGGEQQQQEQPHPQTGASSGGSVEVPAAASGTGRPPPREATESVSSATTSHLDIHPPATEGGPFGTGVRRSPPPVPPLQLGSGGGGQQSKQQPKKNAAAATAVARKKPAATAGGAPPPHLDSTRKQNAADVVAAVAAASNFEHGETSARAMMEVRELRDQLAAAHSRIAQLEGTVEQQRVLLKRCADMMG